MANPPGHGYLALSWIKFMKEVMELKDAWTRVPKTTTLACDVILRMAHAANTVEPPVCVKREPAGTYYETIRLARTYDEFRRVTIAVREDTKARPGDMADVLRWFEQDVFGAITLDVTAEHVAEFKECGLGWRGAEWLMERAREAYLAKQTAANVIPVATGDPPRVVASQGGVVPPPVDKPAAPSVSCPCDACVDRALHEQKRSVCYCYVCTRGHEHWNYDKPTYVDFFGAETACAGVDCWKRCKGEVCQTARALYWGTLEDLYRDAAHTVAKR